MDKYKRGHIGKRNHQRSLVNSPFLAAQTAKGPNITAYKDDRNRILNESGTGDGSDVVARNIDSEGYWEIAKIDAAGGISARP